jgi:hypothetical protein
MRCDVVRILVVLLVLLVPLSTAPFAVNEAHAQVGLTAEEEAYADEVIRITETMSDSFNQLAVLMNNPQFGDVDWTINVAAQFAVWHVSYDEALALSPPPAFADMHTLFVNAMRLYSEASTDAATGIDALDVDLINQAVDKMDEASFLLDLASEEIDAIILERGVPLP